jgi:hypothetical protein
MIHYFIHFTVVVLKKTSRSLDDRTIAISILHRNPK